MRVLSLVSLAACLLLACSGAGDPGVVVGAKSGISQEILGEAVAQALEARGLEVTRRFDLGQTLSAHEALRAGEVDVYVETTGAALAEILRRPRIADADRALHEVEAAYARQFKLTWLPRLGIDDQWVVVMRADKARSLGLPAMSRLGQQASSFALGQPHGFTRRSDGLRGMKRAYGLGFRDVVEMEPARLYPALARGEVDLVIGHATDGALADSGLTVVSDDMEWFPPYEAAPVVRAQALSAHPVIREALGALVGRIGLDDLRRLAAEVEQRPHAVKTAVRALLSPE